MLLVMNSLLGEPVTVVLIGDSTVTGLHSRHDQAGWGWALQEYAQAGVRVSNHAVGGRSSRSFRSEERWEPALAEQPNWVLIQFGHNDQPGKGPERESDPASDYRDHLRRYIAESRSHGARPVLVTPVCRRTFSPDGSLRDSLGAYAEAVRIVALETDTPCIDLHAYSYQQFTHMGPEEAAKLGPSDKPEDHTHFSVEGSRIVAGWLVELMPSQAPELATLFGVSEGAAASQTAMQVETMD